VGYEWIFRNKELYNLLKEYYQDELEKFLLWTEEKLKPAIRVNTLKITPQELKERLENQGFTLKELDFYNEAFFVEYAPFEIGKTIEHYLGYYYVQNISSMIPPLVLNPKPHEMVLDIAAAPGSKTTQMAQMMRNTGVIIANDVAIDRIKALSNNVDRMGALNVIITMVEGFKFGFWFKNSFDRVLVDAPCSAIGTLHKSYEVAKWWGYEKVGKLIRTQKGLVLAAFDCLKPGGTMVYSTCTITPEENEAIINFLLEKREGVIIEEFNIQGIKMRKGLTQWGRFKFHSDLQKTRRIEPFDNDTEGFYIAKIKKGEI